MPGSSPAGLCAGDLASLPRRRQAQLRHRLSLVLVAFVGVGRVPALDDGPESFQGILSAVDGGHVPLVLGGA